MKKIKFKDINGNEHQKIQRTKLDQIIVEYSKKTEASNFYPILSSTQRGMYLQEEYFNKQTASSDTTGYKIVPRGYFTYRSMSDTGSFTFNIQEVVDTGIVSPAYPVFKADKVNSKYLYYYLNHSKKFITQLLSAKEGGTRYALSYNKLKKIEVLIPSIQEQEKIGGFLSTFDKLIQKQQDKIGLLKELKKGYLQKMFPYNDANVPEIRFKGFTDTWEQRELGQLAPIIMGQSPNGVNYTSNPEDYILVQGNADMDNGKVRPRVWTTQITKLAKPNDLIFSVRAPVGSVGKTDYEAVIGRGVASIRGNEFIYQQLLKLDMNGYWKSISTGSTFDSINSAELKTTIVKAPKTNEQEKIGSFMKSIDSLITLHQRKHDQLENLKKGYMQRLFA